MITERFCLRLEETNNKRSSESNNIVQLEQVKEDWEYDLDIKNRKLKMKSFREQGAAWKENK